MTRTDPLPDTVPRLLAAQVASDGERECVVGGTQRLSYADFANAVDRVGEALVAHGIEHGERIGILAGNRPEWLVTYFAAMSVGAIAVGLNTWSTARELAYQLQHAGVRLLFVEQYFRESDFLELLAGAREERALDELEQVITFDAAAPSHGTISFSDWCAAAPTTGDGQLAARRAAVVGDDIGCLLYTSGSTALPKGVPLRQRHLVENMWHIGERQHLNADDRLWLAVSLFWSLACVNAVFAVMTHGGTIVLQHHFDAGEALALIERERLTVFYGTPNMALALAEHEGLAEHDLGSLRTGVTIGTPAQVARIADLGVDGICNVYGLTEAYGNSTVTDANLPLARRLESVGQPLPGTELAILDALTRAPLEAGEAGEIALRGRVMPGYWNDTERTAEAMSEDGWFLTGDLGLVDGAGFLFYRGRLKEIVKTGGINVAPAEVEAVLADHADVELAFVTGIPDARLDEALAAVIVLKPGRAADGEALASHCRAVLAAYKTPRHFRFVTAADLPLTSTGKLQRNRLGELFAW